MKLFELYKPLTEAQLFEREVNKAYNEIITVLEAEGDIEWEPQPEFRGIGGTTTDTGPGVKAAAERKKAAQVEALRKAWNMYKANYLKAKKTNNTSEARNIEAAMKKLKQMAAKAGIDLEQKTLGL